MSLSIIVQEAGGEAAGVERSLLVGGIDEDEVQSPIISSLLSIRRKPLPAQAGEGGAFANFNIGISVKQLVAAASSLIVALHLVRRT